MRGQHEGLGSCSVKSSETFSGERQFEVCWWNGGGGLKKRLKVNPVFKELLNQLPDIFTYGEAQLSKPSGLFLKGYKYILHRSYIKVPNNYRRGLVIFYLEKYQQSTSTFKSACE